MPADPTPPTGADPPGADFTVANFNLHAGIDGWGRPFDAVAACRAIDADILVLEECWTPTDGGRPGTAAAIGSALGYAVIEHPLASGRRAGPHPGADGRWMRPFDWRGSAHAIYLDSQRPLGPRVARSARYAEAEPGRWGIAVLSRFPVTAHRVLDLGHLPRDRVRRAALVLDVDLAGHALTVVGTHMAHLSHGSTVHYRRLQRLLDAEVGTGPAVLAGDMNLWGPPVGALLHGWRRAVRGRTWPAWRPHSQVDHVLVRGPVDVLAGVVLPMAGSDHRPVRVRLALS